MESVAINESIEVGASFRKNGVLPRWFVWQGRKYCVQQTTYIWRERLGEALLMYFAVTDGATSFELSLNQHTLIWTLEKTILSD